MWTPLVGVLGDEEGELRLMAAWCVGTAVQNNEKAQERVSFFFFLFFFYLFTFPFYGDGMLTGVFLVSCCRRDP